MIIKNGEKLYKNFEILTILQKMNFIQVVFVYKKKVTHLRHK